jgi:hypothetical protein
MKLEKFDLHRVLFLAGSLSLIIIYILSWIDVMTDPDQRTGSDFMAFYAAGRSMLEHTPAAAYDLAHLKTNEERVLGFKIANQDVNPFVHPPFILPALWLAAHFDYIPAFHIWTLFMLILSTLSAHIAVKSFSATEDTNRFRVWIGIFLFFPVFISLVNGQDSALLLLGAMVWYYGLTKNSSQLAGLGLALTTIRPQIALVLAIPFIFTPSLRKVWWWFCIGGATLLIVSIMLVGADGVRNFLHILSISASGEGYKINEADMINLIGLMKRIMPEINASTIRTTGWVGTLTGLIILCLIWRKNPSITDGHVSLAIIVAVFTSPHLHYHDLSLLSIPILIVIKRWTATQKVSFEFTTLLLLFISFIFLFTYSIPQLNYSITYVIEIALLVSLWLTESNRFQNVTAH